MRNTFIYGLLRIPAGDGDAGGGASDDAKGGKGAAGDSGDSGDDAGDADGDDDESDGDESGDDEEGDEDDEKDLSDKEQKEAKALYKLLKNPATSKETLRIMAQQAGINLDAKAPEKPAEKKKESQKIIDIISKNLGDEFKFMTPRLAQALEEILGQERESFAAETQRLNETVAEQEVDAAFASLARETKGASRKMEAAMLQLANKVHQAPGTTLKEYVQILYKLAGGPAEGSPSRKDLARRIEKNRSNAGERAAAGASRADRDGGAKAKDAPKGLRAIVEHQYNQMLASAGSAGKKK